MVDFLRQGWQNYLLYSLVVPISENAFFQTIVCILKVIIRNSLKLLIPYAILV